MKSLIHKSIAIGFSLILFLVLLFTSFQIIVYNLNYYEGQYEKRNIAHKVGVSEKDLMFITENMLKYLKDERNTLDMQVTVNNKLEEVFGQREKAHMVDVKDLFIMGTSIRNVGAIILVLFMIYFYFNKNIAFKILGFIKYVFLAIIGLILLLSSLLVINFNKYFTIFHEIFFDNDLWLLDPNEDILINIVPEDFFFETSMYILILFSFLMIISITIAEIIKRKLITK